MAYFGHGCKFTGPLFSAEPPKVKNQHFGIPVKHQLVCGRHFLLASRAVVTIFRRQCFCPYKSFQALLTVIQCLVLLPELVNFVGDSAATLGKPSGPVSRAFGSVVHQLCTPANSAVDPDM